VKAVGIKPDFSEYSAAPPHRWIGPAESHRSMDGQTAGLLMASLSNYGQDTKV
jgi:hypothetical protein